MADSHSKPPAQDPYVVDLIQNSVRFEASGLGQRDLIFSAHINSESAVRELGLLVYPFASSFESLEIVYARVRKPDGTVVNTPESDVQELDSAVSREAPMYTDQREKHIAIKSLSAGDVLELHVRWIIHEAIAPGHFWYTHNFFRSGICRKEVLEFNLPRASAVTFNQTDVQPVIREENDRRIYSFETSNLKRSEESKVPAWEANFGGAKPPDVQLSSFTSWEEVGAWFAALAQPKAVVTPEIRSRAEELTKSAASQDDKIRAIYNFVSTRFRYIGVDLGLSRYTPHAAAEVLTNRYGDCKDKHTLLAALLQALDVSSYPVLISSSFRLDPSVPSPALFDHVITAIPRGDSFLFLDTTPEVAPFGMLLANLRARQALVIPPAGNARLVTTPAEPPFGNYERATIEASMDSKGTLDAKMRFEDRGDSEVILRSAYRATPQNQWQEVTQKIVAAMGFAGTVSDVSVAQPEDFARPFWISFSYHRTDYPEWKSHRIVLPTPPILLTSLTDEQKLSKTPLPLGSLWEVTYDSSVRFPPGFSPFLPRQISEKTDFAEFSATYSVDGRTLHGTFHLKTLAREIPGSERQKFAKFAESVDQVTRSYIFIRGDFPDSPQFAAALLTGGPQVLIPQLEAALSANPDNDALLLRLSDAYLQAGRASDVVDLLTKSLSSRSEVPNSLAVALGLAYLKLGTADKAMTEFKKALGDDAEPEDLSRAAYGLAEANTHLPEALEYSQRAVAAISSKTMDITPDDAEPADFALMGSLAATWDTLGWIKFKMGDFAAAQRYLQASWDLVQQPVSGEHLVETYEKLGNKTKAAAICLMARATLTPGSDTQLTKTLQEKMNRLRPSLTKVSPLLSSRSSPASALQGSVALSDMRFFQVPFHPALKGKDANATFLIFLGNAPKEGRVAFSSGSEELRKAVAAISAVKFSQTIPDATPTRIIRKATLNCNVYSKDCNLVLAPTQEAAATPAALPFSAAPQ